MSANPRYNCLVDQARHPAPDRRIETLRKPVVEILYFDGCPNYEETYALVGSLAAELGLTPTIELVQVSDAEAAARLRFLGSPSVRIDGSDVEPGANHRGEFALSCRAYRTRNGLQGHPDMDWIRSALQRSRVR